MKTGYAYSGPDVQVLVVVVAHGTEFAHKLVKVFVVIDGGAERLTSILFAKLLERVCCQVLILEVVLLEQLLDHFQIVDGVEVQVVGRYDEQNLVECLDRVFRVDFVLVRVVDTPLQVLVEILADFRQLFRMLT